MLADLWWWQRLFVARKLRRIVVGIMNRSLLDFCGHCQDIIVSHRVRQFQVAVIDTSAVRIGKGNQSTLNPQREPLAPKKWGDGALRRGSKVYTPIPVPLASHAPMVAGTESGTNSVIRVGCVATSVASQRKSLRSPCSDFERFNRGRVGSS